MRDDVHSEIVRLDRIAKRARAHRARGEARGDFILEIRAARLEAAAEARLDATVWEEALDDPACSLGATRSLGRVG